MVAFATAIGAALQASTRSAGTMKVQSQAADLAVSKLSEIQMGLTVQEQGPQQYVEERLADWTWEVIAEPAQEQVVMADLPQMTHVEVIIRHVPSGYVYRLAQVVQASSDQLTQADPAPTPGETP